MPHPFEASSADLGADLAPYVDTLVDSLQSSFMLMPKGDDFVEYTLFEDAYQALKRATEGFSRIQCERILHAIDEAPMTLVVLRTILGFSPPEWAYVATDRTGVDVPENYARSLDKRIRANPGRPFRVQPAVANRLAALVKTACELISEGTPDLPAQWFHRLDKVDTGAGSASLRRIADLNVPYPVLLYERFLGRPFATHRDAVSEKVADLMEIPIEDALAEAGVSHRKTKRAEKLPGFDQAPDFIVPDEFNPKIVIEAKITEDSGTARDKITRVQRLALMNREHEAEGKPPFEVIACIDGRGFTRRSDIEKLITYTEGKVFTLATLDEMVPRTGLAGFASNGAAADQA